MSLVCVSVFVVGGDKDDCIGIAIDISKEIAVNLHTYFSAHRNTHTCCNDHNLSKFGPRNR